MTSEVDDDGIVVDDDVDARARSSLSSSIGRLSGSSFAAPTVSRCSRATTVAIGGLSGVSGAGAASAVDGRIMVRRLKKKTNALCCFAF